MWGHLPGATFCRHPLIYVSTGPASLFDLVITRDPDRANAQRVAQRMGKGNPEVFIPCRHVCAKFPNSASQNFLPDAVRTQTRLGHTRDAMRPLHAIPRAN